MLKKLNFLAAIMAGIGTIFMAFVEMKDDSDAKKAANEEADSEETTKEDSDEEES